MSRELEAEPDLARQCHRSFTVKRRRSTRISRMTKDRWIRWSWQYLDVFIIAAAAEVRRHIVQPRARPKSS